MMKKKLNFSKRLYCSVVAIMSLFAVCSSNLHAANNSGSGDVPIVANDSSQGPQEPQIGVKAPGFTATKNGKNVRLADFSNQYVVLNFWASLSQESSEVNAEIAKLEKKYSSSKVAFVGISMEENAEIAKLYSVDSVPAVYLISPDGFIYAIVKSGAELEQTLNSLF